MAKEQTFLQLSQEFGGTKFGPFDAVEIRLGSDPSRNDIVLPEALGISPEHVKILKQQDGSFIVAPTERTATVYLWRQDGRPAKHIATPTAVMPGDAFSLVTAEGPRFFILAEIVKGVGGQDDNTQAPPKKKKGDIGGGVLKEIKRIGLAKFMTTGVGNFFQTAWMMVKTGTIFSPRYIVMGMMMIVPMIMALFAGGLAVFAFWDSSEKSGEIADLKGDLEICNPSGDEDPTFASLTMAILKDREWEQSLTTDPDFMQVYQKKLKTIFARADRYSWVYKRQSSDFVSYKSRLEREMPAGLAAVFAYTAAHEGYVPDREWGLIKANSDRKETCGRGPALVTYRQAYHLDLDVQPDVLVDSSLGTGDDIEAKAASIQAVMDAVEDDREFDPETEVTSEGASIQGGFMCLSLDGEDQRMDTRDLAKGLGKALGKSGKLVPPENQDYWITARLIRYYAADFRYGFDDIDFSSEVPSVALESASPDQKQYALEAAAEVTARAVAIPCMALLAKQEAPHMGEPPSLMQCGVLRLFVDYDIQ